MTTLKHLQEKLIEVQKGKRENLLNEKDIEKAYSMIVKDFENHKSKELIDRYQLNFTVGTSKWSKEGTVLTAYFHDNELIFEIDRILNGATAKTGLQRREKMVKNNGQVGLKFKWFEV